MGRKKLELVGEKFGKLTVIMRANPSKEGYSQWLCECECGNKKVIRQMSLRAGLTSSCGCGMLKTHIENFKHDVLHGGTGTPIYEEWKRLRKSGKLSGTKWDADFVLFRDEVGEPPFTGAKLRAASPGQIGPDNKIWTA